MNDDMQKRILLATLISVIFFVAYDYFLPKSMVIKDTNGQQTNTNVVNSQQLAPQLQTAPTTEKVNISSPVLESKIISKIVSKHFDIEIDSLGRIHQVYLKDHRFKTEESDYLSLFDINSNNPKPLEIRFVDKDLNEEAFKVDVVANKKLLELKNSPITLTLTQNLSTTTLTKTVTFYPNGKYDLNIKVSNDKRYFLSTGFRPSVLVDMMTFHGALLAEADGTISMIDDGDGITNEAHNGVKIAASVDRYYTTALYNLEEGFNVVLLTDREDNPLIFIDGKPDFSLNGYVGAKDFSVLNAINPELTSIIEYGFFTFIAKPMFLVLQYLHDSIGNWGWAIIALTFLVRLILYPLTYKGMVSMQKLKALAPKIKDLQAKYKGDSQKLNMHMMDLYKKEGANPMGGCLPLILQIPVFFSIYRVLLNAIELKGAEWMFWSDLSLMDPYFVLPVLLGVSMYIHQVITPSTFTDPLQAKVFKFLPVIFTFFFITFPAGLVLYWFVNNIFSIAQQYYINKIFERKKAEK